MNFTTDGANLTGYLMKFNIIWIQSVIMVVQCKSSSLMLPSLNMLSITTFPSNNLRSSLMSKKHNWIRCNSYKLWIWLLVKCRRQCKVLNSFEKCNKHFNLLKPTFNNCTFCPHCIYVFCIYLRTNSDLCHLQHKVIGFYNRDEKCLQRGTNWVFK